ncbi:carboxylesterase family protein [Streptomyces bobili]|uniref:carboxylesterase family protein n=1 Tax=Streptomyces bobili TaxID=67280 RepID=UPI0033A1F614
MRGPCLDLGPVPPLPLRPPVESEPASLPGRFDRCGHRCGDRDHRRPELRLRASTADSTKDLLTGPIRIDTGLVSGTEALLSGVAVYKGIPYAASTAGANRWRPPQPLASWNGVRKADTFGDICPQGGAGMGPATGPSSSSSAAPSAAPSAVPSSSPSPSASSSSQPAQSEDCLNLNVWTPASSAKERRPVLVWIYGGRFVSGSGSNPTFDGAGLARKGLVVVTLNYRTGAFGFLSTPELSAESGHSSGNYGLLDQIAALRWVQRNIRS